MQSRVKLYLRSWRGSALWPGDIGANLVGSGWRTVAGGGGGSTVKELRSVADARLGGCKAGIWGLTGAASVGGAGGVVCAGTG